MFDSIQLAGLPKSDLFGYAKDVTFFAKKKTLAFKPGLNILAGPNGSGKSTILKILARACAPCRAGSPPSPRRPCTRAWT